MSNISQFYIVIMSQIQVNPFGLHLIKCTKLESISKHLLIFDDIQSELSIYLLTFLC